MENQIKDIVKDINKLNNIEINNIKEEIDYIIKNKIANENDIEKLFDRMLSLVFVDTNIIYPLYFKLLDYYKNINTEYACDYEKIYHEYFDEKVLKKTK